MDNKNLINLFELLVRVHCYLSDPETISYNQKPYGYDLTRFYTVNETLNNGGYFDRWKAEQFVEQEINRVRSELLNG